MRKNSDFQVGCLVLGGIALVVVCIFMGLTAAVVDAGQYCVTTKFGEVSGTMGEGLHPKAPWTKLNCYNTRLLVYEGAKDHSGKTDFRGDPISSVSSDGQNVAVDFSVIFSVDPKKVETIYTQYGKDTEQVAGLAIQQVRSIVRDVLKSYDAESLYSGEANTQIQLSISELLTAELANYGLVFNDFNLRDTTFSPEYEAAIEQQQIARLEIEKREYEAQAAKFAAEKRITEAQAEADAIRLEGQALRDYPEVLLQSFISEQEVKWGFVDGSILDAVKDMISVGQ